MGTNVMIAAVGLVIGPVLGGALVLIGWQWVFWFNVPFALLGSAWAWAVLHELHRPDEVRGLDLLGTSVLVGFGVFNSPNTSAMMGVVAPTGGASRPARAPWCRTPARSSRSRW